MGRLFTFLLMFSPLFGDEIVGQEGKSYNYWGEFVNMLITLAFLIVLAVGTVWLLKRIMRSKLRQMNQTGGIKILERRSLNPKATLYLVEILGKAVVVAESPAGVHLVTEFPPNAHIALMESSKKEDATPKRSFSEVLKKLVRDRPLKHEHPT